MVKFKDDNLYYFRICQWHVRSRQRHNKRCSLSKVHRFVSRFYQPGWGELYKSMNSSGKHGVYWGIKFFLFLLQNIDCGYSLEPPQRVPAMYILIKKTIL